MHAILFALAAAAPSTTPTPAPAPPPYREAQPDDRFSTIAFDPTADAASELEFAQKGAAISGKKLLIIMGGNWCHDSAALANLIDSPRFVGMITQNYEVLFVDVGVPQTGNGRQQGGFPRAVTANQRNALTGINLKIHMVQQRYIAVC